MSSLRRFLLCTIPALATLGFAATASAETNPCGNIEFTSVTECHFEFEGGCKAKCEPLSFEAACDGQCNAEVSVDCTASCQADCSAECDVDPGSFDCSANCQASCEASAGAECGGDNDCVAYANARCESDCSVQCEATPPTAECSAQCEASCSGSCEAEANFDCSAECSVDLQGGCEADCDAPEGALFCDGQYLAISDIPACVDYLISTFSIELEFSVDIDVDGAAEGCSVSSAPKDAGFGAMFGVGLAAAGLTIARARRRSSNK